MLTNEAFDHWCLNLGFSEQTKLLIAQVTHKKKEESSKGGKGHG